MAVGSRKFLNLVHAWCMRQFDKQEDLDRWLIELEAPLPGESVSKAPSQRELDADGAAFMAAMKNQK